MGQGIAAYVLCGGIGSRLWPLSRPSRPKQFHRLVDGQTLLAATLRRLAVEPRCRTRLIGSALNAELLLDAAGKSGIGPGDVLLEPMRRGTAMAVALAAAHGLTRGDGTVIVTPADHHVDCVRSFWRTLSQAIGPAQDGRIVLVGIPPSEAQTGYGYIEIGEGGRSGHRQVVGFHEKPDRQTARSYLRGGRHCWNSGIFVFRPETVRDAFLAFEPELWAAATGALETAQPEGAFLRLGAAAMERAPALSFDRAILERMPAGLAMVPAEFGWRDVGSWRSLIGLKLSSSAAQYGASTSPVST